VKLKKTSTKLKDIYRALKDSTEVEDWMNPMDLFLEKGEEERKGNDG
jgi:hypothetical protein